MKFSWLPEAIRAAAVGVGLLSATAGAGVPLASAYVLPGEQIIQIVADTIGNSGAAVVQQTVTLPGTAEAVEPVRLRETAHFDFPDRFRSDIASDTAQRVHVRSGRDAVTVLNGVAQPEPDDWTDRYADLLLTGSADGFKRQLRNASVDPSISSLGRHEGRQAFVIGARFPDESVPQLWVDKTTFVPFRWILSGRLEPQMREIRYYGWRKTDGVWYPMRLVFLADDRPVREVDVERVQRRDGLPGDLFNVAEVRAAARRPEAIPPDADGGVEEVRRTIEDFKKIYEP